MSSEHSDYIPVGEFLIRDVKKVTDLFESLEIDYEIEFDDSEIRNMSPHQARMGGTHGLGAVAKLYVDPQKIEEAKIVIEELYPV